MYFQILDHFAFYLDYWVTFSFSWIIVIDDPSLDMQICQDSTPAPDILQVPLQFDGWRCSLASVSWAERTYHHGNTSHCSHCSQCSHCSHFSHCSQIPRHMIIISFILAQLMVKKHIEWPYDIAKGAWWVREPARCYRAQRHLAWNFLLRKMSIFTGSCRYHVPSSCSNLYGCCHHTVLCLVIKHDIFPSLLW